MMKKDKKKRKTISVWQGDWGEIKGEATKREMRVEDLACELLNYAVMECIVKPRRITNGKA